MTATGTPPEVGRDAWLGYRWHRQGLSGAAPDADDLLLAGVQDGRPGTAAQALALRGITGAIGPAGPLVACWSVRGAPHVHRNAQLDAVRDAWAPAPEDDGGPEHADRVAHVAEALAAVVTGPTTKGDASTAVTGRLPELAAWCERCGADHVPDGLFRAAGRQAQLVLGAGEGRATVLLPRPRARQQRVADPRLAVLQALFRLNGPLTPALFRDWSATGTAVTRALWARAGELVPVRVARKRHDVPADLVDGVLAAPPAEGVVLLPPGDPWLRQVDRTLLVPDAARRREIWRPVSAPGALVVDGEVAGSWRYRRGEKALTVTAFGRTAAATRAAAEKSAALVAGALGDPAPSVRWD